jgi:hypothetical protein
MPQIHSGPDLSAVQCWLRNSALLMYFLRRLVSGVEFQSLESVLLRVVVGKSKSLFTVNRRGLGVAHQTPRQKSHHAPEK